VSNCKKKGGKVKVIAALKKPKTLAFCHNKYFDGVVSACTSQADLKEKTQ